LKTHWTDADADVEVALDLGEGDRQRRHFVGDDEDGRSRGRL